MKRLSYISIFLSLITTQIAFGMWLSVPKTEEQAKTKVPEVKHYSDAEIEYKQAELDALGEEKPSSLVFMQSPNFDDDCVAIAEYNALRAEVRIEPVKVKAKAYVKKQLRKYYPGRRCTQGNIHGWPYNYGSFHEPTYNCERYCITVGIGWPFLFHRHQCFRNY